MNGAAGSSHTLEKVLHFPVYWGDHLRKGKAQVHPVERLCPWGFSGIWAWLVLEQQRGWDADDHEVSVLGHREGVGLVHPQEPGAQGLFHTESSPNQTQSLLGDVN